MAVQRPGGDFDIAWGDPAPDSAAGGRAHGFDDFDLDNWNFKPAAVPWYRSRRAVLTMIIAAAAAALVIAGVLLLLRGPSAPQAPEPTPEPTTTSPSTTSPAPPTSPTLRVGVPPAPPSTEEAEQAPVYRPTQRPRTSKKKPEIGVTRTPATRSPISVAPVPRRPHS